MTRLYIQKLQRVWKWDYKDLKILKSDEYKRQQLIKHQLFQKQLATESNRPSLSPGFARNKPKTNQPRIAGKATTRHKLLTSARCRLVPKGPRKLNRSKNIWILIGSGSISLFYVIPYMQKIHKIVKATSLSGIYLNYYYFLLFLINHIGKSLEFKVQDCLNPVKRLWFLSP